MSSLVIVVDIETRPGAAEAFARLIAVNAAASRTEPGCRQFDVCLDPAAPSRVFLYEIYDDDAAFEAHMQAPHYLEFAAAAKPLLESLTVRRLRRAG